MASMPAAGSQASVVVPAISPPVVNLPVLVLTEVAILERSPSSGIYHSDDPVAVSSMLTLVTARPSSGVLRSCWREALMAKGYCFIIVCLFTVWVCTDSSRNDLALLREHFWFLG